MKKYLFTSAIILAFMHGVQAQNYFSGPMYLGGVFYDGSGTSGSQLVSGSTIDVYSGGTWLFNSANVTTPRTNNFYTDYIAFRGGNYSRTTGYVNGYAQANDQAVGFVLPIGQSSYMPLTINSSNDGLTLRGAWYDAKPLNSTFIIEPGGGAGAQFDFLAGYYDLFTSDTLITSVKPTVPGTAVAATHLLGTKDGNNFTDLGPANSNVALKEFWYQLRFANKGVILPLTITGFAATKQGRSSLLNWIIESEQNIATYTVERSGDGRNFTAIGAQASLGNTTAKRSYTFTDLQPLGGTNYYRIKILEKDGKVSYTSIRILNWSNTVVIFLFPNPVKNNATVTGLEDDMMITIMSENGQVIKRIKAQSSTIQVPMATLASGVYYIRVSDKDGLLLANQKVVKQ